MAVLSKDKEQAIKKYLRNSENFIEYNGVRIIDQTEFGRFIAKLFNLPDEVSDKPGMNKVGYLKKQNAELFDGYEIRKGNIFKRDKPLLSVILTTLISTSRDFIKLTSSVIIFFSSSIFPRPQ